MEGSTESMFEIGDKVVYGVVGVCEVENIDTPPIKGISGDYYFLQPVFDSKGIIYSPVDSNKVMIRGIMTVKECDKLKEKLFDIAGIRLICQFTEDIYTVVKLIKKRKDMTVISEKDYIKNIKESGYRSYHLIVHYEVETVKGTTIIPVEIQIRTLGMNFWAIIEHSLQYKYNGEIPAHVKERLNAASDALITLDNEMSSIHDEIINSQTYFMVKANIVSDILSTIQNLYKVANKQVVIKIQDEFYEIFEKGDVNELSRFSRQLDIIAEDYRAQSVQ